MRLNSIPSLFIFLCGVASAQTANEVVAHAIQLEGQAPAKRCVFTISTVNSQAEVLIERLLPGKVHILQRSQNRSWETVIIDDVQYVKNGSSWQISPLHHQSAVVPAIAKIFGQSTWREGETVTVEGIQKRVFTGRLTSRNGTDQMVGDLQMYVDQASGKPTDLRFEGLCDRKSCSWKEQIQYDRTLHIDPPI